MFHADPNGFLQHYSGPSGGGLHAHLSKKAGDVNTVEQDTHLHSSSGEYDAQSRYRTHTQTTTQDHTRKQEAETSQWGHMGTDGASRRPLGPGEVEAK